MSIRSILVPLTRNTERQIAALEAATALASHRRAYLDVLYIKAEPALAFRSIPVLSGNGGTIADTYTMIRQQIDTECEAMHQTFLDVCKRYGVRTAESGTPGSSPSATWIESETYPQNQLARLGRVSDLLVVGRADREGDRALLELSLRSTGRPVLVIPAWNGVLPGRRIAIAWNGSTEAARALAAVMPLLEGAEAVTILTAESDRTAASVADNARVFLARHDIKADVRVFQKNVDPPVGKALLNYCRQLDVDLLVMGAYTRSRAHEFLLGGVTSYMSERADRAVLMMY